MPRIVLLGTCDTKLGELLYLRSKILEASNDNCKVVLVDVGGSPTSHEAIDVTQENLTTKYGPSESQDVGSLARGDVIKYMITCASNWLREAYKNGLENSSQAIHGVVSAGGTGGTSLASGAMRNSLPIGFPKLIVSTAASGDTGPIVEETDISLMYSVVDIAGTNTLLKTILSNAAGSIYGMAHMYEKSLSSSPSELGKKRKRVGLTMFGVTTPCVDKVRQYLESNYEVECFVFHCTGHGGKAMERLVEQGDLDAVLDITTTEICDYLAGGVMSAGGHRLEAALKLGIPYVVSVGATDMVNFGPKGTVPEQYQKAQRKLFEHNPTVTLMRTSPEECRQIGNFIVEKIQKFSAKKENVQVVLPLGGVSMIATPGAPFHDAEADEAIFSSIANGLKDSGVVLINDKRAINDESFAVDIAKQLVTLMCL
ncbi:hypothetical protein AC578_1222 [Pseudocercospora eumusae]|uniref:Uncharacterized protein n=1 Tax=Pseudocercospora eumusae TaxID=321146 RepID=A0A139HCV4_9PEZI|nr:hypothetical protein AC578_1222 [Pseudocercospora eumusae]